MSEKVAANRGIQKFKEGIVVSDKMSKTVVVQTTRLMKHHAYGKYIRRVSKLYAHDEKEECGIGDLIRVRETRPTSKLKRWKVVEILRKAE